MAPPPATSSVAAPAPAPTATVPATATAPGSHATSASVSSTAGSASTIKEGGPATRRIVGSGSNTELRAQIRRERKMQQRQQYPVTGAPANGSTPVGGASCSSSLGATTGAAVAQQLSRPASAMSNRPPSAAAPTGAGSGMGPAAAAHATRRTASTSSTAGTGMLRNTSSNLSHASSNPAGMQRASAQQHLHPPLHGQSGRPSAELVLNTDPHHNSYQQAYQQDHTAFSTVSQASTHGHGHGRTSSQGYTHSQHTQMLEPPQHVWPKELEPEVHSSVIDAIINNFQTKYAEAALKCKDWQAYASKLKTQSRALNLENRLLQQLTERQQKQIHDLELELDTASDERDRSEMDRARLEGRVEELEALLLSQGPSHLRAQSGYTYGGRYNAQQGHGHDDDRVPGGRRSTAPSPALSQAPLDISQRQIRNGPARLQAAARLMQQQQQQALAHGRLSVNGQHVGFQSSSRSGNVDPSELYQTAIDAATAAFETGLDLSVPSARQWDDVEYGDENEPPAFRQPQQERTGPEPGRVLRRAGPLHAPSSRAQSQRNGSHRSNGRGEAQHGPVLTTDDEDSSDSLESESESESERDRRQRSLARASMVAMASMAPEVPAGPPLEERPPTPTGYQQSRRESSGFRSFPSPEDALSYAAPTQELASPSPNIGIPMHMHSSPPFQAPAQSSVRGHHARSNANSHQASLIGTVAASHAAARRDEQVSRMVAPVPRGGHRASDEPPALMSPPPASPMLPPEEFEHGMDDGRASPADILDLDAERREEIGPSPLIGFSDANFLYPDENGHDFDFATGSPMAGPQYGLGLRIGSCAAQEQGPFQPLRLESVAMAASPLPPSDSHQTLVNFESEPKFATDAMVSVSRPSASVRSNGAQRYTVISPPRTKSSNSMQGMAMAGQASLTFSSLAAASSSRPAASEQAVATEQNKRPSAPPVTALGGPSAQGNIARKRSSNSTDADLARSSASIPSLPFMPNSQSAPAGLSDVTNLQRRNGDLLAPTQQTGRLRAHSTLSEAATVRDGAASSRGVHESDRDGEEDAVSRPMSLHLPVSQREAQLRSGSHGPAAPLRVPTSGSGATSQAPHAPPIRTASRNSNLSVTSFQTAGGASGQPSAVPAQNANRTSAGTLSVYSIGGEQLARARNRSRASSHSVHDAIPIVVKDDVFSDAGHGVPSGAAGGGSLAPSASMPTALFSSGGGAANVRNGSSTGGGQHSAPSSSSDLRHHAAATSATVQTQTVAHAVSTSVSASTSGATTGDASTLLHVHMHTSTMRSESKLSNTNSSQSLAASSMTSRSSGAEVHAHSRAESHPGRVSSSGVSALSQSAGHSRASTGATSVSGPGVLRSSEGSGAPPQDKENNYPPVLARGSSSSTLASTQQSLSPDVKRGSDVLSARSNVVSGSELRHQGSSGPFHEGESRLLGRVASSGLAALSPSITRAGRGGGSGYLPRMDSAHASFSRTPMNGGGGGSNGFQVHEDDADESAYAHHAARDCSYHSNDSRQAMEHECYDDGEADGVGPHRQLYARLRSTLEPDHLAKFEKYVHRYDALDIPLEGPRGLINRVRKLLLRGEPDLAQRPDRLKLMKELLREFEALVRVEMPAPSAAATQVIQ
ncbi:hypothetical protein OC834_003835 [Tilletia horrida]|nr:hypothetical protein OC834_003835 [Tilletia horrida]